MLPPKSVWIEAPMLATTFRERTVIPRTTPRLAATRCPSKVKAVVTHWRGMGMVALQSTSCTVLAINSPRELVGDGAPRLILRCTKARLYYPRLMSRPFEKATLADAVARLRPGMKVLLPAACGAPTPL